MYIYSYIHTYIKRNIHKVHTIYTKRGISPPVRPWPSSLHQGHRLVCDRCQTVWRGAARLVSGAVLLRARLLGCVRRTGRRWPTYQSSTQHSTTSTLTRQLTNAAHNQLRVWHTTRDGGKDSYSSTLGHILLNASILHVHDFQRPHREADTFSVLQLPVNMHK